MKKSCENCGCLRFSGNKCIDMTCFRGYVDGDHDGWTKGKPTSVDDLKNPYEVTEDDYKGKVITLR